MPLMLFFERCCAIDASFSCRRAILLPPMFTLDMSRYDADCSLRCHDYFLMPPQRWCRWLFISPYARQFSFRFDISLWCHYAYDDISLRRQLTPCLAFLASLFDYATFIFMRAMLRAAAMLIIWCHDFFRLPSMPFSFITPRCRLFIDCATLTPLFLRFSASLAFRLFRLHSSLADLHTLLPYLLLIFADTPSMLFFALRHAFRICRWWYLCHVARFADCCHAPLRYADCHFADTISMPLLPPTPPAALCQPDVFDFADVSPIFLLSLFAAIVDAALSRRFPHRHGMSRLLPLPCLLLFRYFSFYLPCAAIRRAIWCRHAADAAMPPLALLSLIRAMLPPFDFASPLILFAITPFHCQLMPPLFHDYWFAPLIASCFAIVTALFAFFFFFFRCVIMLPRVFARERVIYHTFMFDAAIDDCFIHTPAAIFAIYADADALPLPPAIFLRLILFFHIPYVHLFHRHFRFSIINMPFAALFLPFSATLFIVICIIFAMTDAATISIFSATLPFVTRWYFFRLYNNATTMLLTLFFFFSLPRSMPLPRFFFFFFLPYAMLACCC